VFVVNTKCPRNAQCENENYRKSPKTQRKGSRSDFRVGGGRQKLISVTSPSPSELVTVRVYRVQLSLHVIVRNHRAENFSAVDGGHQRRDYVTSIPVTRLDHLADGGHKTFLSSAVLERRHISG